MRATIRGIERHPTDGAALTGFLTSGHRAFDRFLGGGLARGALHDIHALEAGDSAAAVGFALAWAANARKAAPRRPLVWIGSDQTGWENGALYGPGLASHGLDPNALILVRTVTVQDALWALEEALRSRAPAAVIGEFPGLPKAYDLTASRRLQLAAQTAQALGLLVFAGVGGSAEGATSAAATRFIIASQPGQTSAGVPGRATWRIDLAKNRMGRTGQFSLEWSHDDIAFTDTERAKPKIKLRTKPETLLRNRLSDPAHGSPEPQGGVIRRFG